ncbi:hypothetical protein SBRCBS47491_003797 [Sporothrix bragantina]|uniref:Uncharacterized protein n=1 Tax=Sporothrix bragantina TaxID=671064 RepID=A0ABP0BJM7_9PEZI
MAVFDCIRALKAWLPYLRPLVFCFPPERAAIRDRWTRAPAVSNAVGTVTTHATIVQCLYTTFQCAATANMTLPDGTFVTRGTKLEIATAAVYADDALYSEASKFDGLRFYRMR